MITESNSIKFFDSIKFELNIIKFHTIELNLLLHLNPNTFTSTIDVD